MAHLEIIFLVCYFVVLVLLSLYGLHRYTMVYLYRRHRQQVPRPEAHFKPEDLPYVTIQLPCFNERYVIGRLIDAVCQFDYPRDRLEVQVLDDSTDDTTTIAKEVAARWRAKGVDIKVIHRTDRTGYKAGALAEGMAVARGELIAVFDADFVPTANFLRETIDFFTDPQIGMVQARWEHINREYSLLTQVQSILLDGHFVIEHTARNRSGRFFNFNGTAGIWRRETIGEAGGWQHDTLTEDLDLSYRAQLAGWRFVFLKDVVSPAEIPVEMNAFKSQQHRWAKGSIQTALKLLPTLLRSDLPWMVKMEAFTHLSNNIAYLLMVVLSIMMPIATVIRIQRGWTESLLVDFPVFVLATFSVGTFYIVSQREIGRSFWTSFKFLPMVLSLGIGLSVNNCKAVLEALAGHKTGFTRTPKYAVTGAEPRRAWLAKTYVRKVDVTPIIELTLGIWFTLAVVVVLLHGRSAFASLPFLLLFQCGFLYVGSLSLFQTSRWFNRLSPAPSDT